MLTQGGQEELDVKNLVGISIEERVTRMKDKQAKWQPWRGGQVKS